MNKNSLSKDIEIVIKTLKDLKLKHGIVEDPDQPVHHIDKAIQELNEARIERMIDEVMNKEAKE